MGEEPWPSTRKPRPLMGLDLEPVHQPAGRRDADAHPGLGHITAVEDGLQVPDPRSSFADTSHHPHRRPRLDEELDPPPSGILECVAGDLRRSGRDPRLVQVGESQQARDLPRPLPGQHDVGLDADLQGQ